MGKRRKPSRQRCASPATEVLYGSNSLPGLPEELMQLLYKRLTTVDLLALLHTSKVMARRVMQYRSGSLELQVTKAPNMARAATRQLLQWAPPACLKLGLHGAGHGPECPGQEPPLQKLEPNEVQAVLGAQGQQPLPCLLHLCLKDFVLRTAVPMGLAASCPNIHTLQLDTCCVGDSYSTQQDSRHSKGGDSSSSDSQTVPSISTLVLKNFTLRQEECAAAGGKQGAADSEDSRSRRRRLREEKQQRKEQEAAFLKKLQQGLPNITCLHLQGYKPAPLEVIDLWAPQLQELHISVYVSDLPALSKLHQLRKLVAPSLSGGDNYMEALLKLPHLEHVELLDMHHLSIDFSAHPCTWRFLRLHLNSAYCARLERLSRLPLHTLTAPLELCCGRPDECVRVCLPPAPTLHAWLVADNGEVTRHEESDQVQEWNARLQKLAQNLRRCGVLVKADHLEWRPNMVDDHRGREAACEREQAATLAAIGPLLGPKAHVTLYFMRAGLQVLEALATSQITMRWLTLNHCEAGSFDARAAVAKLPSLGKLELEDCSGGMCLNYWHDRHHDRVVRLCCDVMEAMTEGPAGRSIDVLVYSRTLGQEVSCEPLIQAVHDQSLHPLTTIQFTATVQVQPYKSCLLAGFERLP